MKTENAEAIYRGIWPGLGRMYNIKVETGQTTIIVRPGEDPKLTGRNLVQFVLSASIRASAKDYLHRTCPSNH